MIYEKLLHQEGRRQRGQIPVAREVRVVIRSSGTSQYGRAYSDSIKPVLSPKTDRRDVNQ